MSCPGVLPKYLDDFPLVFAGRARSVGATEVTLDVTEVFRDDPGGQVIVGRPEVSLADFSGFVFRPGADYLITVTESGLPQGTPNVALCGFSGPASPSLRAVYEEAFH